MTACRSSNTESASDVSLSHLFHLASSTCRVLLCLCCVLLVVCVFVLLFASCVLEVLEASFDLQLRMLDDRPCLIARSAMRKKKSSSTTTSLLSLKNLAVPHSPEHELHRLDIAWLCFVLDGLWTSWKVTSSLSSSFTTPS